MIGLLGKWMYAEEDDVNSCQECLIVEAEEGGWLLVDVELTEQDALLLKDYVVVDESKFGGGRGGEKRKSFLVKQGDGRNIEKCQRYFHGKMISRVLPRNTVQPYKILRPLKCEMPDGNLGMWNAERSQQMNSWLAMLSTKVPRPLSTVGNVPPLRVNVKSVKLPDMQRIRMTSCEQAVIKPINLPPKHVFVEDLSTSVVPFEPSPVKKLLWDLVNIKRKRSFEFVAGMERESENFPLRMTLGQDQVYDLIKLSIRTRRKFHPVANTTESLEPLVVSCESLGLSHTFKPLLALEWRPDQAEEWPAEFQADESDEDEDMWWYTASAIPAFSDICERTSQLTTKLRYQVPRAAMFLWGQIMQLLSCSKKLLCLENTEDPGHGNVLSREPPRGCFLRVCCKDFSEERSRALAEKKTKRRDTNKNLKRAHGALTQKYSDNTNRKRAMDSNRFRRGCGRRGC